MNIDSIKQRAGELADVQGETTVKTHTEGIFVGTVTFAGGQKFRLDTPLKALFFDYGEVEWIN